MEPNSFDREAFRAAVRAAAQPRLAGVTLPGIGHCFVRPLTAGDWVDSHSARARLEADGVPVTPRLRMAIGLAQNLCGPSGEALFDVMSLDDLQTLAALPADAVADALGKARELEDTPGTPSPNA
jgi:hypothetical protein